MKKIVFMLTIAGGLSLNAQKIEISASYGAPSVYGIGHEFAMTLVSSLSKIETPSTSGVAAIGFMIYSRNMKWRYGVDIANEFFGKTKDVSKQNMVSILPKVDYFWFNKDKLSLYSGGSIGVTFTSITYVDKNNKKENYTDLGFNVVPIGIRYGGDLSVFAEANIGMKGIIQGGIAYRF